MHHSIKVGLFPLPVAQTPRNKQVFVAVCSYYWNRVYIGISESLINVSPNHECLCVALRTFYYYLLPSTMCDIPLSFPSSPAIHHCGRQPRRRCSERNASDRGTRQQRHRRGKRRRNRDISPDSHRPNHATQR